MFIPLQNSSDWLPEISNSLRFDGSNDHLIRTFSASGTTATFSFWTKRSSFGTLQCVFGWSNGSTQSYGIHYNADNTLDFNSYSSGYTARKTTTAVYRDPSAWHHVLCVQDTTNATAADRIRIYINGVRVTAFLNSVDPAQNTSLLLSGSTGWTIGVQAGTGSYFFGGYLANFCLIDGQAKNPSDFAYTDPNGQWRSLSKTALQSVVNAGGANSFFLSFDNGTSTTTLGNDASSKGNNWTLTNMVRTGGADDCWSYDTPTNNFATLNQLDKTSGATISNGALIDTLGTPYNTVVRATTAQSSGKWYWEVMQTGGSNYLMTGVARADKAITDVWRNTANGWYYSGFNGYKYTNSASAAYGLAYTINDVIGVALDIDAGTLEFFKNGSSQGVAYNTGLAGLLLSPALHDAAGDTTASINFGQRPVASGQWYPDAGGYFQYAPPTGYKALSTKNLPIPSIIKSSTQFDVITWTGTNGAVGRTFTGINFKPDMVWGKIRNTTGSHTLFDSVRGTGKTLRSDTSGAEVTNEPSGYVSSFNSDGFSTTPGSTDNWYWNSTGNTFVAWLFRAGGTAVSNTAGSITSQVSANLTTGFSIVTYTGTGVNNSATTIGHGLNVAPKMIIVKPLTGTYGWVVYNNNIGNTYALTLNGNNAQIPDGVNKWWNATSPTSSVFTVGDSTTTNPATTIVAYCFAEVPGFSKIGSYTGNGSTDGPFVWCGFRPKYVLMKRTDSTSYWIIHDATRSPYNATISQIYPNVSDAEYTTTIRGIDLLANGFKFRESRDDGLNISGGTYIFMAFAEAPFKYANAR